MNKLQSFIDRFNSLDLKLRVAVFAVVLLVILALDYFLLLGPQLGVIGKVSGQIKTTSEETQRVKADMQRINDIKKGVEGTRQQLEALDNKIRLLSEVPAVLDDMATLANEAGVVIDELVPSKTGPQILVDSPDTKYYSLPIVVEARSGYHMFGLFLDKLESDRLLFMLRGLRLEKNGSGGLEIAATLEIILADKIKK